MKIGKREKLTLHLIGEKQTKQNKKNIHVFKKTSFSSSENKYILIYPVLVTGSRNDDNKLLHSLCTCLNSFHPRFMFAEHLRLTSIAGETPLAKTLCSLTSEVEKEVGTLASRLYRVVRTKPEEGKPTYPAVFVFSFFFSFFYYYCKSNPTWWDLFEVFADVKL